LENRKHKDLYMWLAKPPSGPCARFLVQNIHTMDEMRLTGNCLRGSRPILSFDKAFDSQPYLQLLKEMLSQAFGSPKGHRKTKPFVDHVFLFALVDDRVWFRNYQILAKGKRAQDIRLEEVGPRFVLQLDRIFEGSFGGPILYANPSYVSPNVVRSVNKKTGKYVDRKQSTAKRIAYRAEHYVMPPDELEDVFE